MVRKCKGKGQCKTGRSWEMEDSTRCEVLLSFTIPLPRKGRGEVSSFLVELGDKAYEHSPERLRRESIYNARCRVLPFVCLKAEEVTLPPLDKKLCGITKPPWDQSVACPKKPAFFIGIGCHLPHNVSPFQIKYGA